MRHRRSTPPPLALRLLERACRADEREMVAGDVVELFERRVDEHRRWNRAWFWWQTAMLCAWSFIHGRRVILASLAWRHLMGRTATALRQASRRLIFEWRYAASVVLILGIGIGTAATMLSVVEEVLLRPLAYHEADRLGILHINLGQLRRHPGLSPAEVNDLPELDLLVPAIDRAAGLAGLAPVVECRRRAAAIASALIR